MNIRDLIANSKYLVTFNNANFGVGDDDDSDTVDFAGTDITELAAEVLAAENDPLVRFSAGSNEDLLGFEDDSVVGCFVFNDKQNDCEYVVAVMYTFDN